MLPTTYGRVLPLTQESACSLHDEAGAAAATVVAGGGVFPNNRVAWLVCALPPRAWHCSQPARTASRARQLWPGSVDSVARSSAT